MFFGIEIKYIVIYFVVINIIGFFIMWWDKRQAKWGNWRTPEKTLFMVAFLGGGIGTIAGMYTFRHKTKKLRFTIGFPTILITEIWLIVHLVINQERIINQFYELLRGLF